MTSPWCGRRAILRSCGTSADGRTWRGDATPWRCTSAHARSLQPLMGGYANVDDDVFEVPGGAYRGSAPRSFDAKSQQWSIRWHNSAQMQQDWYPER